MPSRVRVLPKVPDRIPKSQPRLHIDEIEHVVRDFGVQDIAFVDSVFGQQKTGSCDLRRDFAAWSQGQLDLFESR